MRQSQFFDALMGLLLDEVPDRPAAPGKPSMDPGMAARHPLRILLAEDNVVNPKLALRLLQTVGAEFVVGLVAAFFEEAPQMLAATRTAISEVAADLQESGFALDTASNDCNPIMLHRRVAGS